MNTPEAWKLPGTEMTEQADGTFAWTGYVAGPRNFRFSLLDTHEWPANSEYHNDGSNQWWGHWFAPENDNETGVGISLPVNYHHYTKTDNAWLLPADGWYKIVLDPYLKTMTVTQPPHITGVSISEGNSSVNLSGTKQFTATVNGYNSPAQTVTWSIEGTHHTDTTITDGLLSIDASETEITLTIRATSTVDTSQYDEVSVTVLSASTPTVDSITVAIDGTDVTEQARGTTLDFIATVTVSNSAAQTVVWTVAGKDKDGATVTLNAGTTITEGAQNNKATLTIAAAEEAVDLVVTATSTVAGFTNVSGSKSVFVEKYSAVYILGTDFGNWVQPAAGVFAGTALTKGARGVFTINNAQMNTDSTFKFHDNTVSSWNDGKWFTANGNDVAPSGTLDVVVANASGSSNAWKTTAPGKYNISLNTTAETVAFTPIPEVLSVTVTPAAPSVNRGNTKQFTAAVTATHGASEAVAWSVSGNSSVDTTINGTTGLLTVDMEETNTLTVTATSTLVGFTGISGSTTVTVTNAVDSIAITGTDAFPAVSPSAFGIALGETQTFSAAVTTYPTSGDESVTWSLEGDTTFGTEINPTTGVLTIASSEVIPRTITVRATSNLDASKSATVQVKVIQVQDVRLVGGMTAWSTPGTSMTRNADGTFTWTGSVSANDTFRFCLTSNANWTNNWFVSVDSNGQTSQDEDITVGLETNVYWAGNQETNSNWKITAASNYTITVDAGTKKMTVSQN
jgi:hypothetical protein